MTHGYSTVEHVYERLCELRLHSNMRLSSAFATMHTIVLYTLLVPANIQQEMGGRLPATSSSLRALPTASNSARSHATNSVASMQQRLLLAVIVVQQVAQSLWTVHCYLVKDECVIDPPDL